VNAFYVFFQISKKVFCVFLSNDILKTLKKLLATVYPQSVKMSSQLRFGFNYHFYHLFVIVCFIALVNELVMAE